MLTTTFWMHHCDQPTPGKTNVVNHHIKGPLVTTTRMRYICYKPLFIEPVVPTTTYRGHWHQLPHKENTVTSHLWSHSSLHQGIVWTFFITALYCTHINKLYCTALHWIISSSVHSLYWLYTIWPLNAIRYLDHPLMWSPQCIVR